MLFEPLGERLLAAGIAPWRVRRYLAELDDHLAELIEQEQAVGYDTQEATARARSLLGSDDELAQGWLTDPRLKSLTARAPWLVFGILPPIAAISTLLPPTIFLVAVGNADGQMLGHAAATPGWFRMLASSVTQLANLSLLPAVAMLFVILARRQRLSSLWPLLAACLILLLSVRMHYQPPTASHRGSISVGLMPFFLPWARKMFLAEWPLVGAQWLLTLLPAFWFSWTQSVRRRTVG
jgi:hypothetical protein